MAVVTENQNEKIKEAFESGRMEINGRDYAFTATTHQRRRSVLAVLSKYQGMLERADLSFIENQDFKAVEKSMSEIITFDGMQISKMPDHWEQYAEDWIQFVTLGMAVICYPFMKGRLGV